MKILIVTPRYYPETFSINRISCELQKRGHDVTVLTGRPNYGKWQIYQGYEILKNETYHNVKVIRLNEKPRKKGFIGLFLNYVSIYRIYKKYLKKCNEKYDVVFSHILSPIFTISEVGRYCKKTKTGHFLYGLDIWPESLIATSYSTKHSLIYKIIRKESVRIYNTCDLISYASPSAGLYLKNKLNVNVPFRHIYQPCLTKQPTDTELTNHSFKKSNKLSILFCGTIARFNHLHLMIEALSIARCKDKVVFNIVGSGSEMARLQELTKQLGLIDVVIFYGRIPSELTIKYYNKNDVLFVPLFYNSETSKMIPQKLIEYFMYKKPILGMIKGDGETLLKQASSLNFIAEQTVQSLANAIDAIYETPNELLLRCGEENRNFFVNNNRFQLDTIVSELEDSLKETINLNRYKQ